MNKKTCVRCGKPIHWYEGLGWCEDVFGSPCCITAGGHSPKEEE